MRHGRPLQEVRAAMSNTLETCWGNPSSTNALGQAAARAVALARGAVADLIGISADRLLFTSGATEANEAVLRHHLAAGHALVTSEAEHPALSGVYRQAAPQLLRMVGIDADGRWKLLELSKLLEQRPCARRRPKTRAAPAAILADHFFDGRGFMALLPSRFPARRRVDGTAGRSGRRSSRHG